jgi:hypothetical protein
VPHPHTLPLLILILTFSCYRFPLSSYYPHPHTIDRYVVVVVHFHWCYDFKIVNLVSTRPRVSKLEFFVALALVALAQTGKGT